MVRLQSDRRGRCDYVLLARNNWLLPSMRQVARRSGSTPTCAASRTGGSITGKARIGRDRRLILPHFNDRHSGDRRPNKGNRSSHLGNHGLVDSREGLDRDPAPTIARVQSERPGRIFDNSHPLGSSTGEAFLSTPGHLRAYDVLTGKIVWTFRTIPHPGEDGYETWPKDAWRYVGGANTWGRNHADEKRGIAFFPTGSPTYDYVRRRSARRQPVRQLPDRD